MKVLIIGGGIGGLTAAIALRRRGIEADVYERSPMLKEVGAGISLWPNAVKALEFLGLGERLRSISLRNAPLALRRWDGAIISSTPAQELDRRFGGGVLIFHRAELLEALVDSLGNDHLHLGHNFADCDEDANGVRAHFTHGGIAHGDFLVGADGLRSQVRSWLGHSDRARYSGYTAWRTVVPFDSAIVPAESWGCGKRFGMLPTRDGRVYWYAASNAPEGQSDSGGSAKDALLSMFKGWHEPIEDLIRASDGNILRNDIYDREPLARWGRGRVTLLGDAAHPMTPDLGQGACQAIEDALELARCLSAKFDKAGSLQNYEATRIARTSSIVLASRRMGHIGQISSPLLCRMRDAGMGLLPRAITIRGLAPIIGYEKHLGD